MGLFDRLFGRKKEEPAIEEIVKEALENLEESEASTEEHLLNESSVMDSAEPKEKSVDSQEEKVIPILETSEAPKGLSEETVPSSEEFYSELEERLAEDRVLNEVLADKAKVLTDEAEAVTEDKELTEAAPQPEESVAQLQEQTNAEDTKPVETEEKPKPTPSVMESYYAEVQQRIAEAAAHNQAIEEKSEAVTQEAPQPQKTETTTSAPESVQDKYDRSLKKTRTGFGARLNAFFANFRSVDEEFFEELEELLITSDVGVQVASSLAEDLRHEARLENAKKPDALRRVIIEKLVDIYEKDGHFNEKINFQNGLTVMLFVGVNGVGKTTSIGKLAYKYTQEGKKVMLVAADTFRAGAVAQLAEWGRRVDVPVVTGPEKSDPASVVFDGLERAKSENIDVLMIDTAGRLQNKDNLMAELEKIGRIIKRVDPAAPHETFLALDASTGQNALVQAKEFSKITPVTGIVLTKIDGTARGGVVLAIRQELDIPVKLIGFGEKIDDIGEFNSENFMKGLLEGLI
ncbi:Signal recognition particle receptor protein FtsY (alpha subunit) [Streptococcus sinensis]|uniref:Signal recognition particle receptor FtsY n=1 Tax=Streptococcus sinensis TaxID=176090 RepID=A0A0A0DIV3_9STRE|nr:signal recognition particle-docking protein FtsY [Streptococcus sinensis]KGM38079.1 Signal recognition particle receptor protein FtsY (alpha subunit) [Streptococcus sinensis]